MKSERKRDGMEGKARRWKWKRIIKGRVGKRNSREVKGDRKGKPEKGKKSRWKRKEKTRKKKNMEVKEKEL